MFQAKLIVVGGCEHEAEFVLQLPTHLGRGLDNEITLPHPLVSRRHCEIYEKDGVLFVRDLGSLNGTFVGSRRVTHEALQPGELLTIGTVTFRAVYGDYRPDDEGVGVLDQGVLQNGDGESEAGATTLRGAPPSIDGLSVTAADDETEQAPEPQTMPLGSREPSD